MIDDVPRAGSNIERADSDDREDGTSFKRKRLTLACLPCKKRKAKCSKTRPCTTCVLRDEGDRCEYDDGTVVTPAQQLVTWDHFLSLRSRLETIESILELPGSSYDGAQTGGRQGNDLDVGSSRTGRAAGAGNTYGNQPEPSGSSTRHGQTDEPGSQNHFVRRYHRLNELEDAANTLEEFATAGSNQRSRAGSIPHQQQQQKPQGRASPRSSPNPQHSPHHGDPRSAFSPLKGDKKLLAYQIVSHTAVSGHCLPDPDYQHGYHQSMAMEPARAWPSIACPNTSLKLGNPRWERDMEEVLQAIPGEQVLRKLIDEFFLEARRSWHPMHEVLFREELGQFLLYRSYPGYTFDPAWLALLCTMLCTSAIDIQDNPSSLAASPIELQRLDLGKLSRDALLASDTALLCSDWMMKPQLRVLYTFLVRVSRSVDIEMASGVVPGSLQTTIVGTMAGICKLLNLDQLGTDPLKMPDDDPMLPPGSSTLKRQLACQAFNAVFFYDTFSEFRQGSHRNSLSYAFVAGSFTTEASQNFKETMDYASIVPPRPLNEYTENTWEVHKHRIAQHWRRTSENLAVNGVKTYDILLARDAELREQHRELLDLKFIRINPDETSFGVMDSGYHQRYLNLHRPFLIRSYREPRYIYSQRCCVESAFRITALHRETSSRPGLKAWYLYRHHLSAVTVLFIHALHTPYEVPRVKSELRASLRLFEESKVCKLPSIVRAAGRGDNIILAMLQMLESPERSAKSIEHVMKDVVRTVSTPKRTSSNQDSSAASVPTTQGPSPVTGVQPDPVNPVLQMFMFDDTDRILQAIETSQNTSESNGWIPARNDPTMPLMYDQDMLAAMLNWQDRSIQLDHPAPSVFNQSMF